MVLQKKKFQRRVEDFCCEVCGMKVRGNGYTDHCPKCLYSKHVDVWPGDRKAGCGGLMEPVRAVQKGGKWRIVYRCQKCGQRRVNDVASGDNFGTVIELSICK